MRTAIVARTATTAFRALALALVTLELFIGPSASGTARAAQLTCFVVGSLSVIVWEVAVWRERADDAAPWLVALFAVMAASAGACTTGHGGVLITFAMLAAVGAGSSASLAKAWPIAAVGALAITVGAIATHASPVSTLGDCLEVTVALLIGYTRRSYNIRVEQSALLLTQAEQLRVEQARVATLDERARIAREIHDVLAHSLGALGIQIQAARALLSEQGDASQALRVLDRAQRIATEGLGETRNAVHALRADRLPLEQELDALAVSHRAMHDVAVAVEVHGDPRPLGPESSVALLRVAQESLVNAAKHSAGQPVTITLTYDPERTHLIVSNALHGSGSVEDTGLMTVDGGYGLVGMRERLLLLQGSLVASANDGRWEVAAQVPV